MSFITKDMKCLDCGNTTIGYDFEIFDIEDGWGFISCPHCGGGDQQVPVD
jgi:ribosomal protein S27E